VLSGHAKAGVNQKAASMQGESDCDGNRVRYDAQQSARGPEISIERTNFTW